MIVDPTVVALILGVGGIGVLGLTEMIKRLFHAEGVAAYVISFVASAGATAFTLATTSSFTVLALVIYTVIVFLEANGIYKATVKTNAA